MPGGPRLASHGWRSMFVSASPPTTHSVLGGVEPAHGSVLYCALEDTQRRLQRRIDRLLSPRAQEWPARLTLATQWRRLDEGGVDDIAAWAESVTDPRLAVLDTLAGVRPARAAAEQIYDADYRALVELHRLAGERGMAVLVLHHTRKLDADDPLDTVSGTLGLAGCADTVHVLQRTSQGTTLYIRGRDIEEAERAMTWNATTCRWTICGDAAELHRSQGRQAILAALAGGGEMSPQDIAAVATMKPDAARQLLGRMVEDDEIERVGRGRYRLKPMPPSQPSHRHNEI